jgi:hypothetical protein
LLFAPTIGAALVARHHFLWVYCPACRTTRDIDLRTLDRHRDAAVTSLIPSLSCRSCRPHAPFAQLVRLSKRAGLKPRAWFRGGSFDRPFSPPLPCAPEKMFHINYLNGGVRRSRTTDLLNAIKRSFQ